MQPLCSGMSLIHGKSIPTQQSMAPRCGIPHGEYTDFVHESDLKFKLRTFPQDFEYGWPHVIPQYLTGNDTVQYQTGAPISHASYKQKARLTSSIHRSAETILSTASVSGRIDHHNVTLMVQKLKKAWDGIGIVQHHDSMPGTMSAAGIYTTWGTSDLNATKLQNSICKTSDCKVLEDYTSMLDIAEDIGTAVLNTAAAGAGHQDVSVENHEALLLLLPNLSLLMALRTLVLQRFPCLRTCFCTQVKKRCRAILAQSNP